MIVSSVKYELFPHPRGLIISRTGERYRRKWLGPRRLSGTDKRLARVSWDRMRASTTL